MFFMEQLAVGSIVEGKVTSITKFGAFCALPDGKSGLVHISEISYSYVNDVHDVLTEGDAVKVKIISIDDAGRINLSIKKTAPPPTYRKPSPRREHNYSSSSQSRGPSSYASSNSSAATSASFEDQLKQFMAASDSKLSGIRAAERRSSRRRSH